MNRKISKNGEVVRYDIPLFEVPEVVTPDKKAVSRILLFNQIIIFYIMGTFTYYEDEHGEKIMVPEKEGKHNIFSFPLQTVFALNFEYNNEHDVYHLLVNHKPLVAFKDYNWARKVYIDLFKLQSTGSLIDGDESIELIEDTIFDLRDTSDEFENLDDAESKDFEENI